MTITCCATPIIILVFKDRPEKDKEALLFTKRYWAISVSRKSLPFPTFIVCTKRSEHFLKPDLPPKDKPSLQKGLYISEKVQNKIMKLKLTALNILYTAQEDPYDRLQKLVLEPQKIEAWVDLEVFASGYY